MSQYLQDHSSIVENAHKYCDLTVFSDLHTSCRDSKHLRMPFVKNLHGFLSKQGCLRLPGPPNVGLTKIQAAINLPCGAALAAPLWRSRGAKKRQKAVSSGTVDGAVGGAQRTRKINDMSLVWSSSAVHIAAIQWCRRKTSPYHMHCCSCKSTAYMNLVYHRASTNLRHSIYTPSARDARTP